MGVLLPACFIILTVHAVAAPPLPPLSGKVFLNQSVTVFSNNGIIRASPGSEVRILKTNAEQLTVRTGDGVHLRVSASQLTQDQSLAEALANVEAIQQSFRHQRLRDAQLTYAEEQTALGKAQFESFAQARRNHPEKPPSGPISHPWNLIGTALDIKGDGTAIVHHPKKPNKRGRRK